MGETISLPIHLAADALALIDNEKEKEVAAMTLSGKTKKDLSATVALFYPSTEILTLSL